MGPILAFILFMRQLIYHSCPSRISSDNNVAKHFTVELQNTLNFDLTSDTGQMFPGNGIYDFKRITSTSTADWLWFWRFIHGNFYHLEHGSFR